MLPRIPKPGGVTKPGIRLMASLLMVVVVVAACEKVPLPRSDETSPQLRWVITNHGSGERLEFAAGADPVIVEVDGNTVVSLIAHDDEGIHKIRLDGPATGYTCVRDDIARQVGPGLTAPGEEHALGPDGDGLVLTEIFTLTNVYFHFDCGDGWTLDGGRAEIYGYGENYFGGTADSKLVLIFNP